MIRRLLCLVPLIALLAGCGGGGNGPASLSATYGPVSANSPFAGVWEGYWWDGQAYQDDLAITVRPDGTFTGQVSDPFIPQPAAVTGNVRDDGTLAATYRFPDRDRVTLAGTVGLQDGGSRLTGSLRARQGSESGDFQIVLTRSQP